MFAGVELGDSPVDAFDGVPSAQACRSRCDANLECAAWNFHVNGTQKSECYLPPRREIWGGLLERPRAGAARARARAGAEPAAAQDLPEVVVIAQ